MKTMLPFLAVIVLAALVPGCQSSSSSKAEGTEAAEPQPTGPSGVFQIDLNKSTVKWTGAMLGVSGHFGTVSLSDGQLILDHGVVTGGKFVADMTSIVATDDNFDPKSANGREKLAAHLRSPDFFEVDRSPKATYTVTSGSGTVADGKLSIRSRIHNETVKDIRVEEADGVVRVSGTMVFNRQRYGVSWSNPVKESVLSDDITLEVELTAFR